MTSAAQKLDHHINTTSESPVRKEKTLIIDPTSSFKLEQSILENIDKISELSYSDNRVLSSSLSEPRELILPQLNQKFNIETTFDYEADALINDTSLRYNPWSKTILGKTYQNERSNKRSRKQPGLIRTDEFLNSGPYGVIYFHY